MHLSQPNAPTYDTPTHLPLLSHRQTHSHIYSVEESCKFRGLVWFVGFLKKNFSLENLEQKGSKNLYLYICGQGWDGRKGDEWMDEQIVITVA